MVSVEDATQIVLENTLSPGSETVAIENATGRVLFEPIIADRDLPPFDRVTMDGIAIRWEDYEKGIRKFNITGTQFAGASSIELTQEADCIEIMTGATLSSTAGCIIRYEDLLIRGAIAEVTVPCKKGQNIHFKGSDAKAGQVLVGENTWLRPAEIAVAASVGVTALNVRKLPKVVIISSGDEIVEIGKDPQPSEIRNSNAYCIASLLAQHGIVAGKLHIKDDKDASVIQIKAALLEYDVILLCGGVSKGKKDFIPQALEDAGVEKLFHQVNQRPGKPFWFGKRENTVVFALPGNPVSTFFCARRYLIPWLKKTLHQNPEDHSWAVLSEDYTFNPTLSYFLQVKISEDKASRVAVPITGGGSGDFVNMVSADGFLELSSKEDSLYKKGEVFKFWSF
jgi:molybdopterin molybdotransferase